MAETCQYWSHRNGEGRTEYLLLQPWMDMDGHTPSGSSSTGGRENQADLCPRPSAAPRERGSEQHLGSKQGQTSSKGKTFSRCWQQTEGLQTHIQQNVAASQHRTLNHVFTTKSSWTIIPPTLISSDKTEQI